MRRLFANANYDFVARRKLMFTISAVAIAICVAAAAYWQVARGSWLNYGVDFTGGSIIQVSIADGTAGEEQVRRVASAAVPGATVSAFGDANDFRIRTPVTSEGETTQSTDAVMG